MYLTYKHSNSTIGYYNIQENSSEMPKEFSQIDIHNKKEMISNTNCIHPQKCEHAFDTEFDVRLHILSGYQT